jgi:hypothetical protein
MKIRINKSHLIQGVKFDYIVANKPMIDKKISFCYYENIFYIINHFDGGSVFKYDNYQSFRKKINDIILDW